MEYIWACTGNSPLPLFYSWLMLLSILKHFFPFKGWLLQPCLPYALGDESLWNVATNGGRTMFYIKQPMLDFAAYFSLGVLSHVLVLYSFGLYTMKFNHEILIVGSQRRLRPHCFLRLNIVLSMCWQPFHVSIGSVQGALVAGWGWENRVPSFLLSFILTFVSFVWWRGLNFLFI